MSGWFQGLQNLSSLREHASEFASEILRESSSSEDVDLGDKLKLLEKKIEDLNVEIATLRENNVSLLEKAKKAEEKYEQAGEPSFDVETFGGMPCMPSEPHPTTHGGLFSPKSYQFEVRKLSDEIKELKAECSHWKQLAKQADEKHENEMTDMQLKYQAEVVKNQSGSESGAKIHDPDVISSTASKNHSEDDWDSWNVESSENGNENQQAVVIARICNQDASTNTQSLELFETTNQNLVETQAHLISQLETLRHEVLKKDDVIEQLKLENQEMTQAYDDLNSEFEREKDENGLVVNNNKNLSTKLDALKRDLIEYEERYELCKVDNEKAVRQLDTLSSNFEQLKTELAESRHLDQTTANDWRSRLESLTQELAGSLEKREEMSKNVEQFETVIEGFQEKFSKFSSENEVLREENKILQQSMQECGDVKKILIETDQELCEIRRTAKESELERLKCELSLRQEIENLQCEKDEWKNEEKFEMDQLRETFRIVESELKHEIDRLTGENLHLKSREVLSCSSGEENDETTLHNEEGTPTRVTQRETNGANGGSPYIQVDVVRRGVAPPTVTQTGDLNWHEAPTVIHVQNIGCQTEEGGVERTAAFQPMVEAYTETIEDFSQALEYKLEMQDLHSALDEKEASIFSLNEANSDLQKKYDFLQEKLIEESKSDLEQLMEKHSEILSAKNEEIEELEENCDRIGAEKYQLERKFDEISAKNFHTENLEIIELKKIIDDQKSIIERSKNDQSVLLVEKQQLILLVNQKHEESIKYYHELQQNLQKLEKIDTQPEMIESVAKKSIIEAATQTDQPFFDQNLKSKLESDLQSAQFELKSKIDLLKSHEFSLADASQKNQFEFEQMKQNMNIVIHSKDRAISELYAERQRSDGLVEQLKISEDLAQKNAKEVERLRQHLVKIEEAYTAEVVKSEERETELRLKLRKLEDESLDQSDFLKNGNEKLINQLNELSSNLNLAIEQRDAAFSQLADVQLDLERSQKSLENLQNVLVQFQHEKDSKVRHELDRYKKEIERLKQQNGQNLDTIELLEKDLASKSENNLRALSLEDEVVQKDALVNGLRCQLTNSEEKCSGLRNKIIDLEKIRDGKIDKEILKNLLLGYFCAPADKKPQVALLLGSVLQFSAEEYQKCQQGGSVAGWLNFLKVGSPAAGGSGSAADQSSLTSQFVKFLEAESAPKPAPSPLTPPVRQPVAGNPLASVGAPRSESRSHTPVSPGLAPTGLQVELSRTSRSSSSSDFLRDALKTSENAKIL